MLCDNSRMIFIATIQFCHCF